MQCTSKKKPFETEAKANEWVLFWNATKSENQNKLTNCYKCNECGKWHTTKRVDGVEKILKRVEKQVTEQMNDALESIQEVKEIRKDIIEIKKVLHDRFNHLQLLVKINKIILEKLKEM